MELLPKTFLVPGVFSFLLAINFSLLLSRFCWIFIVSFSFVCSYGNKILITENRHLVTHLGNPHLITRLVVQNDLYKRSVFQVYTQCTGIQVTLLPAPTSLSSELNQDHAAVIGSRGQRWQRQGWGQSRLQDDTAGVYQQLFFSSWVHAWATSSGDFSSR